MKAAALTNQCAGSVPGRQGATGISTRFFLSLEDNLCGYFAPIKVQSLMQGHGHENGERLGNRMVTKTPLKNLQRKGRKAENFDMRKTLLRIYDDVATTSVRHLTTSRKTR